MVKNKPIYHTRISKSMERLRFYNDFSIDLSFEHDKLVYFCPFSGYLPYEPHHKKPRLRCFRPIYHTRISKSMERLRFYNDFSIDLSFEHDKLVYFCPLSGYLPYEPHHNKPRLRCFRPGKSQTGLLSYRVSRERVLKVRLKQVEALYYPSSEQQRR